ncbi:hypothetical protein AAW02_01380 [Aeromonas dhakensis]|uniref:hypothetical protein n=1 Tax=Aeromonas dhakensis TaxID=196024 RepID=UPI000C0BE1B8|nr:hypothetical protein AAW03_05325 [Aeromonas dhakensis]PHS90556.1 hypothetical protein AAW02_01380 [Aeromonas dhakensis]
MRFISLSLSLRLGLQPHLVFLTSVVLLRARILVSSHGVAIPALGDDGSLSESAVIRVQVDEIAR